MTEPGSLEGRVLRLEQLGPALRGEVVTARQDAAAARVLAAGADHDVSEVRVEMRAHRAALNALQEGQSELRTELRTEVRDLRAVMESKFALVDAGIQHIITLLDDRNSGS